MDIRGAGQPQETRPEERGLAYRDKRGVNKHKGKGKIAERRTDLGAETMRGHSQEGQITA